MDTSKAKKNTKKDDNKEREFIEIRSHEVSNVRVIDTKRGDMVVFNLTLNGVTIYSCRVGTGKNGDFISFPQYKGNNGNYYNYVYAAISDEDSKKILEEIQAELNK